MIPRRAATTTRWLAGNFCILWILLSPPAFANWKMQEFLILYSYGWPADQVTGALTQATAMQIAAAHYNTVMCEPSQLDWVAMAGLRCLVMGRSQGPPDWIGEAVSPATARNLASNPAVWGYYVTDEPDNRNWRRRTLFQQLGDRVKEYRSADPNHVAWINVSAALAGYLPNYMDIVKPDLLSFDQYRWWQGAESDWWRNLEGHRDAALNAGVPLIIWTESNTDEKRFTARLPPPEGNATKIRWDIYTSLAYGVKGVQWFLGSTNADVAALNAELLAMGPTLVRLESRQVFHTSGVPREGRRLPEANWYSTDTPDLVIGELVDPREANATYFLIANKSVDHDIDTVFEIRQRQVLAVEEINRGSSGRTPLPVDRQAGTTRIRLHFAAGDGRLVRVETH